MIKKFQLKNGLTVLLAESRKSPVVSVQMWVNTGSADEVKGEEGISHFIEHLLFKGTRKFKVGEIASTIEGSGGELNAYTSFDQTVFHVTISSQFIETGLEAISEMMGFPAFDATEIDNEREVVIEEINRGKDNPHQQASRELFSALYKKHPYGIPVIGYEENIRRVKRETIINYYHHRYNPKNMTLIVVGDFSANEMKPLVHKYYSEFHQFPLRKVRRQKEPEQKTPRIRVKNGPFKETIVHLAFRTPSAKHTDIAALDTLALILGQGDSSRLMNALRIEAPLTNYAVASTFSSRDPGFFAVTMSLEVDQLEEALEKLKTELVRFLQHGPTPEEVRKAIINVESDELYGLETVDGMARKFGTFEHLFGDYKHHEMFLKQVNALTPRELLRVARKYLNPDKMAIIMLTEKEDGVFKKTLQKWAKSYGRDYLAAKRTRQEESKNLKRPKLRWKLPEKNTQATFDKIVLPSGATLIYRLTKDSPVVCLRAAFLGGLRFEPVTQGGLSELLTRVWTSGTRNLSEVQILERMESIATAINAFAGRNTAGMTMTSLASFAKQGYELFAESLTAPHISSAAVDREKQIMSQYLKTRMDNPSQTAVLKFMKSMFGEHPYGRDMFGDNDSIGRLNVQAAEDFLHGICHRGNLTLVLVGDVDIHEWSDQLQEMSCRLPEGPRWQKSFQVKYPQQDVRVFEATQKAQSHIVLGFPGLTFKDDDRHTLSVMQSVLAGQGGRLFIELRDKESLAYTVSPVRMDGIDAGYFGAYIACSPEKAAKAVDMMEHELARLTKEKISPVELERAKRYLIGRHDIDLQRSSAVATSILFDEVYGIPYDDTFKYAEHINKVSADKVLELARRIFSQPKVLSVVGQQQPW